MSLSKKMKPSQDQEDFERIKKYLQECPHVSRHHPLIKAALVAVDKEQGRIERDRKLQLKFSKQQQQKTTTGALAVDPLEEGLVVVENNPDSPRAIPPTAEEEMEWQDVPDKGTESCGEASFLGQTLAKAVIDQLSQHQQKVKSPVAAIAVALHAGLRSDTLGFACTGLLEPERHDGFAPPVRELAAHQFLPVSWDSGSSKIALRYRKIGTGALVLLVEHCEDNDMITVRLQSAGTKEPSPLKIEFVLGEHVNLDSWNTAVKASPYISPILHYKSLALLMTNFCRTFDLGAMEEDRSANATKPAPYLDQTATYTYHSEFIPSRSGDIPVGPYGTSDVASRVPSTFGEAFPGIVPMGVGGDFSGDLVPAGIYDPRFLPGGGRMGGNLMGPNHPMFQGDPAGMRGGLPYGGPGSMQPRFDPIYPDGIELPGGHVPTKRIGRPRPSGEPNPDHLPPPNSFDNNMFL